MAPAPLRSAAPAPRARPRPRRACPQPAPPALSPGPRRRARRGHGAPLLRGAAAALTGAGPARRSSGPSSDGKWRALLLLLMDGGATPAARGVSRNCFQGPLPRPLRSPRSGRAASGANEMREAGRANPPGGQ